MHWKLRVGFGRSECRSPEGGATAYRLPPHCILPDLTHRRVQEVPLESQVDMTSFVSLQ